MLKQRFNWLVNLVVLPTAIWVTVTGIIAELFDINDFILHKYPAFGLAVLLAIHFWLHLPQWLGGTRRLLTGWRSRSAGAIAPSRKAATTPADFTRRNVLIWLGSALGGLLVGNFLAPTRRTHLPTDEDIGVVYHHWSKPGNVSLISTVIEWGTQPPLFKEYADAPKIPLPVVTPRDGMSVEQAIVQRRSVRDYVGELTLDELNRLLFYSTGINDRRWGSGLRAAPSAGAQYPIETYLVVNYVAGLAQGIYHYNIRDHTLELIRVGDFRQAITDAALGQEFFSKAGVVFALTGIFQRTRWRYRDRTYRYVMLEAGHIGQNIYLSAVAQGLGACAVGAFWDDDVNRLLGVDGKVEATLYLLTVGRP